MYQWIEDLKLPVRVGRDKTRSTVDPGRLIYKYDPTSRT
jgi:hypothetical protein